MSTKRAKTPTFAPALPAVLPPAAVMGVLVDANARFMSCPGNWQPWGQGHAFPVFLELKPCKGGKVPMVHVKCSVCGLRAFLSGTWWLRGGFTREAIKGLAPFAVDGEGRPLNPR